MSFFHSKKLIDIYRQMQHDKETALDRQMRQNFVAICNFVDKELENQIFVNELLQYGKIDFDIKDIRGINLPNENDLGNRYTMIDNLNSANVKLFPSLSLLDIKKYNFYKQGVYFYLWQEPFLNNTKPNKCYLTISFNNEARKNKVNFLAKLINQIKK